MTAQPTRPPRYEIRVSAELRLPDGKLATAVTRNLSEGGVCVELDRPLAEGVELEVGLFVVEDEIEAEGKRSLAVRGTVQWSSEADRGFAAGLKFINVSAETQAQLVAAIKRLG
jgi:hypothetical protein